MTETLDTPTTQRQPLHELERKALKHLWVHGWEIDWEELAEKEGLKVFVSGDNCTLTDVHGEKFLDGLAGLFLVNVGHGRREIGDAMAKQAGQLAYTASTNYANCASVLLAETLASLTPGDLDRIFLCSGGSEAVESALKIARQAQFLRGYPKRYKIIARRGSYHGMTFGAMSLSQARNEEYFGPFLYGVSYVPSPNNYRDLFGYEGVASDLVCAQALEQEILAQGPETVAAFIGEPISASNGTHIPTAEYWREIRRICDKYGVLLIIDEIITGFGRTGRLFASEHFDVVPDIMTMAKGLSSGYAPIAAVAVRPTVFEPFQTKNHPFAHLLTFGGHAVSAAAASRNIEILNDENLISESATKGAHLRALLEELVTSHPTVGQARCLGLMGGVELVKNKETKENWGLSHSFMKGLLDKTHRRQLLTRVWDFVHLSPPLVVTHDELDRMVSIIDESLTANEHEYAAEIG